MRYDLCFSVQFSMFTAVFNFFFNTSHAGLFWCQGGIKERLNPTACTGRWETRWQSKESQNHSTPIFFLLFLSRRTIRKLDGVKTSMVPGMEAQLVVQCLTVWPSFKPLACQITSPNSARVGRCWWRMTSTRFVEPWGTAVMLKLKGKFSYGFQKCTEKTQFVVKASHGILANFQNKCLEKVDHMKQRR